MKKITFALLLTLASSMSYASYLQSCQLEVTVADVQPLHQLGVSGNGQTLVANVLVAAAEDTGSHDPRACASLVNKSLALTSQSETEIATLFNAVKDGSVLKLKYFFVSHFGPQGARSSTKISLLQE